MTAKGPGLSKPPNDEKRRIFRENVQVNYHFIMLTRAEYHEYFLYPIHFTRHRPLLVYICDAEYIESIPGLDSCANPAYPLLYVIPEMKVPNGSIPVIASLVGIPMEYIDNGSVKPSVALGAVVALVYHRSLNLPRTLY